MKDIKLLVFITTITLFFACNKNDQKKDTIPVYAGIYDSTYYHCILPTPMKINIIWDSLNLYGFGTNSLDIDNDGQTDLSISLSLLNEDSLHLITYFPEPYPSLAIQPNVNFKPLTYSEYTYTGLGSGYTTMFIKGLSYNERLDTNSNFQNYATLYDIWREIPPNAIGPSFGELYYINSICYIGFKFKVDRYGWIKVDLTDPKSPSFISFAVQL